MPTSISERIRARALGEGFNAVGFAAAETDAGGDLAAFVAEGLHGDMGWLADTLARRRDPKALWAVAKSAVMVGLSYAPAEDPLAVLARPERGGISVYARNRDYHDVLKGRLKQLAGWMVAKFGGEVKVFCDTAPLMEKPLAAGAGIGWQGKHTNLVSLSHGSWLFLGAVLTTLELPVDAPADNRCGSCRRCLDACPTGALPAPYRIDARRCISYLTIEHKGHIPRDLRPLMGNRVYGCDDCLAVPLEQVRAPHGGAETDRARHAECAEAGGPGGTRRRRLPRPVRGLPGQAHGPRAVLAQRSHRHRQ